jgi:hypothetical protein
VRRGARLVKDEALFDRFLGRRRLRSFFCILLLLLALALGLVVLDVGGSDLGDLIRGARNTHSEQTEAWAYERIKRHAEIPLTSAT